MLEIYAARGVDAIAPLIIIPPEIYAATIDADPIRQGMSTPFNCYRASVKKNRVKFLPLLQSISIRYPYPGFPAAPANSTDGGTYITQWGTYIADMLNDSECVVINGLKTVGMYDTPHMPTAMWTALKAAVTSAGGPSAFNLIDWSHSPSDAARLGAIAIVNYPPNPGLPVGNTQHAYSEMVTINTALATPTGVGFSGVISYRQDQRPLSHSGSDAVTPWVDEPTLVEHFQTSYAMMRRVVSGFGVTLVSLHAADEIAEGGQGYDPSKQADRDQAGGTRALDAGCKWGKHPLTRPTTYTYSLSPENSLVVKSGTWTMARVLGGTWAAANVVYDNRTLSSSTPGDSLTFSHINSTAFAIYGDTSVSGGTFNVQIDGGTAVPVSTAGSAAHHVQLWSSGALTEGTHTILITNVSGTIVTDAIQITCNPRNFPLV